MFFDVWKAYKEACGKEPWMEDRIRVLQELERRIRESAMVYYSARDKNGEPQHYRITPEEAGMLLTEAAKAMDLIIEVSK